MHYLCRLGFRASDKQILYYGTFTACGMWRGNKTQFNSERTGERANEHRCTFTSPTGLRLHGVRKGEFYMYVCVCVCLCSKNLSIKIYRTIILPVVLYGCETLSLTSREERRLTVFENRVLRRVFGSKRDEVTGEWRKLHDEELSDLYCSPYIFRMIKSRRMRWAGHVARMGER